MPAPAPVPHILIVDDDEGLLILMADALTGENFSVATAGSAREARTRLAERRPDLLLLDLKLPDGEGPPLVAELRRTAPVPFVIVTGQGDEKVAVEMMKQGALDYVMKDTGLIELLPTVVRRALGAVSQARALAAAQAEHRRLEHEVLEVGERERHSIGADLHDGLGQQLTAIEFMCAALKADAADRPELERGLGEMGKRLREAIAQTRYLARGLVPVGDGADALQTGLAELAERIASLGRTRCVFESPTPVKVSEPFVAGHLYRIAQEAVNNALKHARAHRIAIRLVAEADALVLEIADDGAGLPKAVARGATRATLGLGVMRHRAKLIGAELTIASKRGEGVVVTCRRPQTS